MCGIFGIIFNSPISEIDFNKNHKADFDRLSNQIQHRGPDKTINIYHEAGVALSFHRLSILDLSDAGDQPFVYEDENRIVYVLCNGEIYNYKSLIIEHNLITKSHSDCEVILHLYLKYGNEFYNLLNSEHACAIIDIDKTYGDVSPLFFGDRFGIRPLFITKTKEYLMFSSELLKVDIDSTTERLKSCHSREYHKDNYSRNELYPEIEEENYKSYYHLDKIPILEEYNDIMEGDDDIMERDDDVMEEEDNFIFGKCVIKNVSIDKCVIKNVSIDKCVMEDVSIDKCVMEDVSIKKDMMKEIKRLPRIECKGKSKKMKRIIRKRIFKALYKAVELRLQADRKIGFLCSGGVDSGIICAIASIIFKETGKPFYTFSVGMPGGTDEKYAKITSKHIGSIHTHVIFSEEEFLAAIPEVIKCIGSFDITTIRASCGQYLISKWISENTDIKILLGGDGSDELCGSYKYFHNAPFDIAFHNECIRLLSNIHCFDGLRADRCIAHFGIEARFPFLDINFIETYLSAPIHMRRPQNGVEKYLLRSSFTKDITDTEDDILPYEVLFRSKVALSDGISSAKRSWHTVVQEHANSFVTDEEYNENKDLYKHCPPISKESYWYRKLFTEHFGNNESVAMTIPKFWMPNSEWCPGITDPSARELKELCHD
jgi:asparagine synthetase B (glutamine-hydrolysing)